jgi:transcriptional regulator NrdR family protein
VNDPEAHNRQPDEEPRGIICIKCGCAHFYTLDTTRVRNGKIRRLKQCRHCGKRIHTYEEIFGSR